MIYVAMYLIAIVAANLLVASFGPAVTILNAFLFIGLDLTARDKLHDAWRGNGLIWKMAALIATGSMLSWLLNRDAGPIALASFVAFMLANVADALVYQALGNRAKFLRVNGSNIVSAGVDSLVFPTLAFGDLLWPIVIGQFVAKVVGGFVWSLALSWRTSWKDLLPSVSRGKFFSVRSISSIESTYRRLVICVCWIKFSWEWGWR